MGDSLREFIADVESLRSAVRASGTRQLGSAKLRGRVQALVDRFFKQTRPAIASAEIQLEELRNVDSAMQKLLALSHGRALVTKYLNLLKLIKSGLVLLDSSRGVALQQGSQRELVAEVDQKILLMLQRVVPSAAASYSQALHDLQAPSRLSWRGPATDLREALRETLDHLAPDDHLTKEPGFKLEPDAKGPTMKQKVRYILRKRGVSRSLAATPEAAADSVETAVGSFIRSVYTRSSVSTHTPTDKTEVLRVRDWVRVTLCELLEIAT